PVAAVDADRHRAGRRGDGHAAVGIAVDPGAAAVAHRHGLAKVVVIDRHPRVLPARPQQRTGTPMRATRFAVKLDAESTPTLQSYSAPKLTLLFLGQTTTQRQSRDRRQLYCRQTNPSAAVAEEGRSGSREPALRPCLP